MGEKKEKPTKRKLDKSKKKGDVSKSEEIILLLTVTVTIEIILRMAINGLERLERLYVISLRLTNLPFNSAIQIITISMISELCMFILPLAGMVIILRIAGSWVQFGIVFSPSVIALRMDRLNPVNKLKQIFSGSQIIELLMNFIKFLILIYLTYQTIISRTDDIINLSRETLRMFPLMLFSIMREILHNFMILFVFLSAFDLFIKRYFFLKKQGMSIEEMRRELQDTEGNPLIKSYRKILSALLSLPSESRHVEDPPGNILKDTDVVIYDGSSVAIALSYKKNTFSLPQIVFNARGKNANYLICLSKQEKVPVIHSTVLANTLSQGKAGECIPADIIEQVAHIYTTLDQQNRISAE
ncbi:hypothetical protein EHW66_08335 [Erwinia psidii]|uniref:EscU/YscU/HrcU family type III secretion system export apparatus switch protein n=1 Tax=Erwinia psidii TaxID=69224 RepID=UPI00226AFF04|nr:EscU/YscU/HrcU family type III secretion system export apparatus switch protein [Erwinia psidii]MCX8965015.1 hypothetical protein [Erwinia psidii]